MRLLLLLLTISLAAPVQAQADAVAHAERQLRTTLAAAGLSAGEAAYLASCMVRERAPDGDACSEARVDALMAQASGAPQTTAPPVAAPTPPATDGDRGETPAAEPESDGSGTASVVMSGAPAYTFDGTAYSMAVSETFAVVALATAPLDAGTWRVPDDAPFTMVELRLAGGLTEGAQDATNGLALYHWGLDRTAAGGPSYRVESATVTFASVRDRRAVGTLDASVTSLASDGSVLGTHRLSASFGAVPGRIPPP